MNVTKPRRFLHNQKKRKTNEKKNKGLFAEINVVAPAPSRDYYALLVYQKRFLWTRWKISHGPFSNPIQRVVNMEEYLRDGTMQNEITYIFGQDTTDLIQHLAQEKWNLISMPTKILQKIFSYMTVPDILSLSQVCKRLSKECSKNEVWKSICKRQWKILIHTDIEKAGLIGWKKVYLEKMRPKRYRPDSARHPRSSILQRSRVTSVNSATNLNTPDSRTSTPKSNFTMPKRIQELKKGENLRSASEIFGKDFKVFSTSTGKSTDRTVRGKSNSKMSDLRPKSSSRASMTPRVNERKFIQSLFPTVKLVPLAENPPQKDIQQNSKTPQKKVSSIRNRLSVVQPTEIQSGRLKPNISRPSTGKTVKTKL